MPPKIVRLDVWALRHKPSIRVQVLMLGTLRINCSMKSSAVVYADLRDGEVDIRQTSEFRRMFTRVDQETHRE